MSQFMPESTPSTPSSVVTPQSSVASDADIALMLKVFNAALARPDLVPEGFLTYMQDYIQVSRLSIPIGQIQGFSQFIAQKALVSASESTTATAYGDLATVGPELASLGSGRYIVLFGAGTITNNTNQAVSYVGCEVNGVSPTSDAVVQYSPAFNSMVSSIMGAFIVDLTQQTNSLKVVYKVGSFIGTWANRFLIALRYANL